MAAVRLTASDDFNTAWAMPFDVLTRVDSRMADLAVSWPREFQLSVQCFLA